MSFPVRYALERAQEHLLSLDAPEAVIARLEAGDGADSERELARRWAARLLRAQDPDGSWDGHLLATAEKLLALRELTEAGELREVDPGIPKALDWLRGRRGAADRFGEGCDERRHRLGICEHFLGGFYGPGRAEAPLGNVRLASGAAIAGHADARLTVSCVALQASLAWRVSGRDTWLHVEGLQRLLRLWDAGRLEEVGEAGVVAAVAALARAGEHGGARDAAARGLTLIGGRQRGDGSWVAVDAFHALELFLIAQQEELAPQTVQRTLDYGARLLVSTQQPDGSWGRGRGPRGTLVAWRVLRTAT